MSRALPTATDCTFGHGKGEAICGIYPAGSMAILADRAHYLTNVAVNAGVLLALFLTKLTDWRRADPAFAALISGQTLWNAWDITQEALTQLLTESQQKRHRIQAAALACTGVHNIHDLRTRYAGDRVFVEFYLEVDDNLAVDRGHRIGDGPKWPLPISSPVPWR
jgi:ferrous-iron efflux pump FieF